MPMASVSRAVAVNMELRRSPRRAWRVSRARLSNKALRGIFLILGRSGRARLMMFRRFHAAGRKFPYNVVLQKSARFWGLLQRGVHVSQRQTADEYVRLLA